MVSQYERRRPNILMVIGLVLLMAFPILLIGSNARYMIIMYRIYPLWEEKQITLDCFHLSNHIRYMLQKRLTAPLIELSGMDIHAVRTDAAKFKRDFPELTGVYRLTDKGGIITGFSSITDADLWGRMTETGAGVKDTLKLKSAFWDTTLGYALAKIEMGDDVFSFGFVQRGGEYTVAVTDPAGLKDQLPRIIRSFELEMRMFQDYFGRYQSFPGEVKFFDSNGENFYTHGHRLPYPKKGEYEIYAYSLPWKIMIYIGDESSTKELFKEYDMYQKFPWRVVVYFGLSIICILLLPFLGPYLTGYRKKIENN